MSNNESIDNESSVQQDKKVFGLTVREILLILISLIFLGIIIYHNFFRPELIDDEYISNLESNIAQLEKESATNAEQIAQLKSESTSNTEQLAQLEGDLANNAEQITQLGDELEKKIEQITQLESELTEKDEQITQLKSELLIESEQITQLRSELEDKTEQFAKLENESATKSEQITQLNEEFASNRDQISKLEDKSDAKTENISQLEEELTSNREQIAQLESDSVDKSEKISQLEEELTSNRKQIAQLESDSVGKSDQIAQLENELKDKFNEISLLELESLSKSDQMLQLEIESSDKSDQIAELQIENRKLLNRIEELEQLINIPVVEESEWPPFINLDEVSNFSFEIGKATLSPDLEYFLIESVAGEIESYVDTDNVKIVEVIGHTDDLPIVRGATSFDHDIIDALEGSFPIEQLYPTDNAGLGIARAVSVINVLKNVEGLSNLTFIPLSGGQLIKPDIEEEDSKLTGGSNVRRRIEIRIRGDNGTKYFGIKF